MIIWLRNSPTTRNFQQSAVLCLEADTEGELQDDNYDY